MGQSDLWHPLHIAMGSVPRSLISKPLLRLILQGTAAWTQLLPPAEEQVLAFNETKQAKNNKDNRTVSYVEKLPSGSAVQTVPEPRKQMHPNVRLRLAGLAPKSICSNNVLLTVTR